MVDRDFTRSGGTSQVYTKVLIRGYVMTQVLERGIVTTNYEHELLARVAAAPESARSSFSPL